MRKILYIIIFLININPILGIETKIIYKIQNEIITNVDIKNEFQYLLALNDELKNLDKEKILNISKQSIIKEKIKKIEILKVFKTLEIDQNFTDAIIRNIYLKLKLKSEAEFISHLSKYNLDINGVTTKIVIEALWNELIVQKYNTTIKIDQKKIRNKVIDSSKNKTKEYLLSEIVFEVKKKDEIKDKYNEIVESINEIGFGNSASVYSFSNTAKISGRIGWIGEGSLSDNIKIEIIRLNKGDISKPIILPNGILILKIDDIKEVGIDINIESEVKKIMNYERNKQLNVYSNIYFNKVKKNIGFNE